MRVLLVADIHANLTALDAVIADAGPVDAVWCLGDTVGYGPRPNECSDWVAANASITVLGNHDAACLGRVDITEFNPAAQAATRWTAGNLSARTREWLASLPFQVVEGDLTLVHGSPRDPVWEYLLDAASANENFAYFDTRVCLVGHTHVPAVFARTRDGRGAVARPARADTAFELTARRCIVNPGSVGQPRDGDPRAAYAILDTAAGSLTPRRCDYDIAETQRQMAEAELPPVLSARLAYGL